MRKLGNLARTARALCVWVAAVFLVLALSGCGAEEEAPETASESTQLSEGPAETGNLETGDEAGAPALGRKMF